MKLSISTTEQNITKLKKDYESYVKELHSTADNDYVSEAEVQSAKSKWLKGIRQVEKAEKELEKLKDEIFETEQKIEKVDLFLSNFNPDNQRKKRCSKRD
jgi:methyl-accepting chemotaxis protein